MKKYVLFLSVMLGLAMLGGCAGSQPSVTEPAATTAAPTQAPTTVPQETEEDIVYEGDASSYYIDVAYAEQIARYHTALSEKWDEGKYFENNMSALPCYYYEGNPLDNVGFGFVDLDNDGHWELIIGAILNADKDLTAFEIWTVVDGEPVMLAQAAPGTAMFWSMWKRTICGMLSMKAPAAPSAMLPII